MRQQVVDRRNDEDTGVRVHESGRLTAEIAERHGHPDLEAAAPALYAKVH